MKKRIVIGVIVTALLIVGLFSLLRRGLESTDAAMIEANVVAVAPKVEGYVTQVAITDNQHVQAGDILVSIDPSEYQAAFDKARAEFDLAIARLAEAGHHYDSTKIAAPSSLESARSQVIAAKAEWVRAGKDLTRLRKMNESARSKQQLDAAVAEERSTHSAYMDAQARLRTAQTAPSTIAAAQAGLTGLQAAADAAKANLESARIDLEATQIKAPFDGRVTKRTVELGSYAQVGRPLLYVVSDAVWVVANFKENQLAHMKAGQPVSISVDAYPDMKLSGKVDSIQAGTGARFSAFPPENATGNFVKVVQRVPVKIVLDPLKDDQKDRILGPGMSVEPEVNTNP